MSETSPIEAEVRSVVAGLGAEGEIIDCDPELADTAAFCAHYGYPPEQSANTILVASKRPQGSFSACVVLSTTRLDVNRMGRDLMEVKKVSFAPPELTADVTGMVMGGVTPFGLPDGLPLFVDGAVVGHPWVIVGGGSRDMKVKVDPEVFSRMTNTRVVEGLARPIES